MIRAKKHLGQHFLADKNIAKKITSLLPNNSMPVLEVGPGTGVLTKFLIEKFHDRLFVVELDSESIDVLKNDIPELENRIFFGDFLQLKLNEIFAEKFMIIGNFPYNISSQLLFKIIEQHQQIPHVTGMFQKEVAERIASGYNTKQYGILSVWTQLFYTVKYCFTVQQHLFIPPPKVQSSVITLEHNGRDLKEVDPKFLLKVIKTAFNQRRKTLRNSLSLMFDRNQLNDSMLNLRPEQLSVDRFIELGIYLQKLMV